MMTSTNFKEWTENFSTNLVNEIFRIIDKKSMGGNADASRYVACAVLHKFLGSILWKTLAEDPKINISKKDHLEYIMKNFSETKTAVQDSVSLAFQVAMSSFSGQEIEYYCQVKTVPKATSQALN